MEFGDFYLRANSRWKLKACGICGLRLSDVEIAQKRPGQMAKSAQRGKKFVEE